MKLYHVTPYDSVMSILTHGVRPGESRGLRGPTARYGNFHPPSTVWLTRTPFYILFSHGGEDWINRVRPVILTINVNGLELDQPNRWEYTHDGEIPAWRIERVTHVT